MKALNLIVAVSANGVIGNAGRIPWRCPEDLQHFKRMTMGHAVIMGRKTWDSLPAKARPLPGRTNIVLTRHPFGSTGAISAQSVDDALECAYRVDVSPFVIGGAGVYRAAMPLVTTIYHTLIKADYEGDVCLSLPTQDFEWAGTLWDTPEAMCQRWERLP